ncbi:MAG: glycosyltransferase [Pseudomonadota bacterium]
MTAVALIIGNHGTPDQLDLCLASLYAQDHTDFETLVADSGHDDRSDDVVAHHAAHLAGGVRHIQAPGSDANLASALNAAVLSTMAEYLVFLGGDCVAQPKFISAHVSVADYGYFGYSETLPLDSAITGAINARSLGTGLAFEERWLESVSPAWHARHLKGTALGKFKDWLNRDTPGLRYWNADSSSCFRDELLAINGFDRDVEDGRLERDVANRLQNNGQEPVSAGPAGNVLRLLPPGDDWRALSGGRLPAELAPGGEVRAVNGLEELTTEADAA